MKFRVHGAKEDWKVRFGQVRQLSKNEAERKKMLEDFPALERLVLQVRAETAPIILNEIECWDRLNSRTRDIESQNFVFDLSKYLTEGYQVRRGCEQEPEKLNNPLYDRTQTENQGDARHNSFSNIRTK